MQLNVLLDVRSLPGPWLAFLDHPVRTTNVLAASNSEIRSILVVNNNSNKVIN